MTDKKSQNSMLHPPIQTSPLGCGISDGLKLETWTWQGFVARVLDAGGMIYEKEGCRTLAEAMAALEKGIGKWFDEEGR